MAERTIFAMTRPNTNGYPPYINVTLQREHGEVRVIMRDDDGLKTAEAHFSIEEWASFLREQKALSRG